MTGAMEQSSQKSQREVETSSRVPLDIAGKGLTPLPPLDESTPSEGAIQILPSPQTPAAFGPNATFAQETHQYVREYIKLADQKAAFIFTAGATLLAFLYQRNLSQRWLKFPNAWSLGDSLAFIAMLGLSSAILASLVVVVPRLKGSRRGFIFWEAIAEFESSTQYSNAVSKLNAFELAQARFDHCFELSKICKQKYRVLYFSIWAGAIGLASTVLYLLFF